MPIYEYKCQKCEKINSILERRESSGNFWAKLFQRGNDKKCGYCGSKNLSRVFSTFSVASTQSNADMLNDLSKMGNVNFVPDYRPKGPPPGGCPYVQQQSLPSSSEKKIDRIQLS